MKEEFKVLDEQRASLRLLFSLAYDCPCNPRTELRECLRRYGVGGTAFQSSLETLRKLGLVHETRTRRGGHMETLTSLTERGLMIAEAVIKLHGIL